MGIDLKNKFAIDKIIRTLKKIKSYKIKLNSIKEYYTEHKEINFRDVNLRTDIVIHFTSLTNARKIINDRSLLINDDGYISLSEFDFHEFNIHAKDNKLKYGFGFFKDDLIKADETLFTPVYANNIDFIKRRFNLGDKGNSIFVEQESDPTINYTSIREIRSLKDISLEYCSLFFRNLLIDDSKKLNYDPKNTLSDLGIFQQPFQSKWVNYFMKKQKWYFNVKNNQIIIMDDACLIDEDKNHPLLTIDALINKLEKYK